MDNILTFIGFTAAFAFYAYWVLAVILTVITISCIHDESSGFFALTTCLIVLAYVTLKACGISLDYFKELSVAQIITYFVSYFVVGVVWSFIKWYMKLINIRDTFRDWKNEYFAKHKLEDDFLETPFVSDVQQRLNANFWRGLGDKTRINFDTDRQSMLTTAEGLKQLKPNASKHKQSICKWIIAWPFSAIWTLIDDPIYKLVNAIFNSLKGLYQRTADSVFKDV
jgi:hypothetical protein